MKQVLTLLLVSVIFYILYDFVGGQLWLLDYKYGLSFIPLEKCLPYENLRSNPALQEECAFQYNLIYWAESFVYGVIVGAAISLLAYFGAKLRPFKISSAYFMFSVAVLHTIYSFTYAYSTTIFPFVNQSLLTGLHHLSRSYFTALVAAYIVAYVYNIYGAQPNQALKAQPSAAGTPQSGAP